jgi:hypothetical protein
LVRLSYFYIVVHQATIYTRAVISTEVRRRVGSSGRSSGSEEAYKVYAALSVAHEFVPVVIETLGTWGSEGIAYLDEVVRRTTALTGDQRATSFLK